MAQQTSGMHSVFVWRQIGWRHLGWCVRFWNISIKWSVSYVWKHYDALRKKILLGEFHEGGYLCFHRYITFLNVRLKQFVCVCVCLCLPAFLHPACKHRIRSLSKCACCRKLSSENISGKRLGSLLLCTSLHHMSLSEIFAVHRMRDEINPNAIFSPSCAFLKVAKIVLILAR